MKPTDEQILDLNHELISLLKALEHCSTKEEAVCMVQVALGNIDRNFVRQVLPKGQEMLLGNTIRASTLDIKIPNNLPNHRELTLRELWKIAHDQFGERADLTSQRKTR